MLSELDIMLQIKQHFRDGVLHRDEFKIVYVAPMKVLFIVHILIYHVTCLVLVVIHIHMPFVGISCRGDIDIQPSFGSSEFDCERTYRGHAAF